MANRTPEEIRAQREAWLIRKAAREARQDIPLQPLLQPGEVVEIPPMPEVTEPSTQAKTTAPTGSEVTGSPPEPGVIEPPAEMSAALKPQAPERKRTPEEIRAQREAFLAAKAAKAGGTTALVTKPAEPAPAQPPAARPIEVDKPKPAPKPAPAAPVLSPTVDTHITRREFLNYAWLASIALFSVETIGLSLWFAFPNFKAGQFGGQFAIGAVAEVLPEVNASPIPYTDGKFWLVDLDTTNRHGEPRKGILALYKVCTHLGCLYDWVPVTNRFECPCHGSKFELAGDYIEGPARRSLDRFVIQAVAPDGSIKETDAEGNPLVINGDETLIIDTGQRILGAAVA